MRAVAFLLALLLPTGLSAQIAGNASGSFPITVGTASVKILESSTGNRLKLKFCNPSSTATIWIMFGQAAVAQGPGTYAIPSQWCVSIDAPIPGDPIFAIASAASSPLTVAVGLP